LEWIKAKSPGLIPNVRPEVVRRLARSEDQDRFLAGIEAAGLSMPDKAPNE